MNIDFTKIAEQMLTAPDGQELQWAIWNLHHAFYLGGAGRHELVCCLTDRLFDFFTVRLQPIPQDGPAAAKVARTMALEQKFTSRIDANRPSVDTADFDDFMDLSEKVKNTADVAEINGLFDSIEKLLLDTSDGSELLNYLKQPFLADAKALYLEAFPDLAEEPLACRAVILADALAGGFFPAAEDQLFLISSYSGTLTVSDPATIGQMGEDELAELYRVCVDMARYASVTAFHRIAKTVARQCRELLAAMPQPVPEEEDIKAEYYQKLLLFFAALENEGRILPWAALE